MTFFGLLQHETRLSVLNFGVRKAAGPEEPLANKERLLFVTGYRYVLPKKGANLPRSEVNLTSTLSYSLHSAISGPVSWFDS